MNKKANITLKASGKTMNIKANSMEQAIEVLVAWISTLIEHEIKDISERETLYEALEIFFGKRKANIRGDEND